MARPTLAVASHAGLARARLAIAAGVVTTAVACSGTLVGASPTPAATPATNPAAIPLGDGHVTTTPRVGWVDSCVTHFTGGGASANGPWINEKHKTWDSLTKVHVHGAVSWAGAHFSATSEGRYRVIASADLPVGHTTGVFPIARSDPAYKYDQNPNRITAHAIAWHLSLDPSKVTHPSCLPLGPVGILSDGVLLFDALDAGGRDAVAHELQDSCDEHPAPGDVLHHHDVPSCLVAKATASSTLVGYALDGYGIYVERGSNGKLLTNASLDRCHGRTSLVLWNGRRQRVFHYDATVEYPYTIGCFEGTPIVAKVG